MRLRPPVGPSRPPVRPHWPSGHVHPNLRVPPHWERPRRRPVYHNWNPVHWERDYLISVTVIRFGQTFAWNPHSWKHHVPNEVAGLVYRSERTSFDLREAFESQVEEYHLMKYDGCEETLGHVKAMDNALGKLRARLGVGSEDEVRALVAAAADHAVFVRRSFQDHSYLHDLVPEQWDHLSGDIRELARRYHLVTSL